MDENVNEPIKGKGLPKKTIMIGVIAVAVIAVIAIVVCLVLNVAKPSYKKQIKEFASACQSDEKMEKYVKKYVNLRAVYAMQEADEPEDFEKEYKDAKKKDYTDEDFINETKDAFCEYVTEDSEIEVSDIGDLKDVSDDGLFGSTLSDIKGMKEAKCTLKSEGEEIDCYAYFYKGKILILVPDLTTMLNN